MRGRRSVELGPGARGKRVDLVGYSDGNGDSEPSKASSTALSSNMTQARVREREEVVGVQAGGACLRRFERAAETPCTFFTRGYPVASQWTRIDSESLIADLLLLDNS